MLTATTQCQYHYGGPVECRAVQLSHYTRLAKNWQTPIWMCKNCRSNVLGQFRYVRDETHVIRLARPQIEAKLAIVPKDAEPATNMYILLAQAEQDGRRTE